MNGGAAEDSLTLGVAGFCYEDLHSPAGLERLYDTFLEEVADRFPDLHTEYLGFRDSLGENMDPVAVSELLVRLAPLVSEFIARLFGVSDEREEQRQAVSRELDSIFLFRTEIVGTLSKHYRETAPDTSDRAAIANTLELLLRCAFPDLAGSADQEGRIASAAARLWRLANATADESRAGEIRALRERLAADPDGADAFGREAKLADAEFADALLEHIRCWAWLAQTDGDLTAQVADWVSFKQPEKRDFDALVAFDLETRDGYSVWKGRAETRRRRDGFDLTGRRYERRRILYEIDHCIYCHDRDTDSCSKGMRNRKDGTYKVNPLGANVTGCPLQEKISEMHFVKRQGDSIGALALVAIDNPMCAGTGYSICNDCTKGCIYQKTEPVDIPQIETSVLTDVLFMPYGFEIYSLLTRWNPLNVRRPYALPYHGMNALVVGQGPAGYTLAHYLLNEGFGVVGIDALKIEPLPAELVGDGKRQPAPIRDYSALYEKLDERVLTGFGGVAEYGITVRWDKNFLKVIYLLLARRAAFRCYGGVRFGGTLTIEDAWQLGFDHVAIATGAGRPTIIDIENNLIRGIRKATDFLMALQFTGAGRMESLANLQVRLPAGIIGGGLTSIDTATECAAYYPLQVEKTLDRYERISADIGEERLRGEFNDEELEILDEALTHGRAIREERRRAEAAGEEPDFQPLIESWGGVTLFYRKPFEVSPAYRQNHEEINKALDEGIALAPGMNPLSAVADETGKLCAVRFRRNDGESGDNAEIELPMRNLFIAAGTSPNVTYELEHPGTFEMDGKFFQRYEPAWADGETRLEPMHDTLWPKLGKPAPLTSYRKDGKYISFFGDTHPVYTGTVVKAMASAKNGYPAILRLHRDEIRAADPGLQKDRDEGLSTLFSRLDDLLLADIVEIKRLAPAILEIVVRAPMAASHFEPGHLYRVQNFQSTAPRVADTLLAAEGLALPGFWTDKEKGLISLIALEDGGSSRLCAGWKPGERIAVMGPTGAPAEIPSGKTVLLAGDGIGNAVLLTIGKAMRAAGNRVIHFAGYGSACDLHSLEEFEAASDVTVWVAGPAAGAEPMATSRSGDKALIGDLIDAVEAYAKGELGAPAIPLDEVDRLIAIGSERMLARLKEARHGRLSPFLTTHTAIGSINSPMQCMMKGVCAQCLCRHVDPDSGREFFVYSCYDQNQNLDSVDFANLDARLGQNSAQEKLSNLWMDRLLGPSA
jgi:NADPH-dependent glutamate synthase beta subunit-like oxidoreductase/NAD(P)H-flavin reductase